MPSNSVNKISFSPIKSPRTFEGISSEIKRLIFKGILRPGDKLPSEIELARQFNVGRQTVREALRILELSGFITIQKGSAGGPIIEDTIFNTISNSFLDAFLMKKITPEELTVARLETEKAVLHYVLNNADDSDIKSLQDNIAQAKKKADANIRPFRDNIEFHKLLAKASKNQIFVLIVESVMAVVADFFSRLEPEFEVSKRVIESHENILNAIISKKRDEAITLLEKDLREVGKRFQDIMDRLTR